MAPKYIFVTGSVIKRFFYRVSWLVFLFFILPVFAMLIIHFFKLVIIGKMNLSEFNNHVFEHSFGPVVHFYAGIKDRVLAVVTRLRS